MTDNMRAFISSLPNAAEPDAAKREQNEREIARRVGGLPLKERLRFESQLREMVREQDEKLGFRGKWALAQASDALKKGKK